MFYSGKPGQGIIVARGARDNLSFSSAGFIAWRCEYDKNKYQLQQWYFNNMVTQIIKYSIIYEYEPKIFISSAKLGGSLYYYTVDLFLNDDG